MRLKTIGIIALILLANRAIAQLPQTLKAPLAGQVVLDTISDKFDVNVFSLEAPPPDADKIKLKEIKQQSRALYPYRKGVQASKTTSVPMPIIDKGYISDSSTGIPPDNDFAVNTSNRSLAVVNSSLAIHDATTGQFLTRKSLRAFATVLGLNNLTMDFKFDPKVIYDPEHDKYIMVMLNSTNDRNWIIVGFSKTNDANGLWNLYRFYGNYANDTTWFDYPAIAISKEELFLTGNKILYNGSWQAGFRKTVVYQFDKIGGYNGDTQLTYRIWDTIAHNGRNIRNLFPVKNHGTTLSSGMYFLSNRNFDIQNDSIFLVHIPSTLAASNPTLSVQVLKSPLSYGVPPEGRQADTGITLATNDGRILGAFSYDNQIQFTSASMVSATGASGIFHGVVQNYKTAPIISAAHYITIDSLDFGYPNLSFAGASPSGGVTSIINFNYTGARRYAGMGAVFYDGTAHSDMLDVKSGDTLVKQIISGKTQRWGDYTGSQREYQNTGVVWVNGIYGKKTERYGCWASRLLSPSPTRTSTTSKNTVAAKLFPNPAFELVSIEFFNYEEGILQFALLNASGQVLQRIHEQKCKKGKNSIDFNILSLPSGNYYLHISKADGTKVSSHPFVKK